MSQVGLPVPWPCSLRTESGGLGATAVTRPTVQEKRRTARSEVSVVPRVVYTRGGCDEKKHPLWEVVEADESLQKPRNTFGKKRLLGLQADAALEDAALEVLSGQL